jgi:hypothetical protein
LCQSLGCAHAINVLREIVEQWCNNDRSSIFDDIHQSPGDLQSQVFEYKSVCILQVRLERPLFVLEWLSSGVLYGEPLSIGAELRI